MLHISFSTRCFLLMLLLAIALSPHIVLAESGGTPTLRLHTGNVDPLSLEISANRKGMSRGPAAEGYCFLQFTGPVLDEWKTEVENVGARLFDYVPDFAFVVRADAATQASLLELPFVRAVMPLSPEHVVSFPVRDEALEKGGEPVNLAIRLFDDADATAVLDTMADMGAIVSDVAETMGATFVVLSIPGSRLDELAAIPGIRWIDVTPEVEVNNETATKTSGARNVWADFGYYGQGQTVAVLDTGLGSGDLSTMHPDFSDGAGGSRVVALVPTPYNRTGTVSDPEGHGTHVAGTVLGNGIMSGADPAGSTFPDDCYAGIAPKATLVFQASQNDHTDITPAEFVATYEQARDLNARVSTTSLAFHAFLYANLRDDFVASNPSMLTISAAGNSGMDGNRDGVADLGSLAGATGGKNVVTVGASESLRRDFHLTWAKTLEPGIAPPSADPIHSDPMTNNAGGVSLFSSRGPSMDGRYKPDVLAPGSYVISTDREDGYTRMAGTSMAAPQVAGAAALIREYLADKRGIASPSAALMKAIIVNSAKDTSPGQYGAGEFREIPPVPNNVSGWGVLNVRGAVSPQAPFSIDYHDMQNAPLATGGSEDFTFAVSDSGVPLKVHLVWSDAAGSEQANGRLVNDLDLSATSPSGRIYYPNNARLPDVTAPFLSAAPDGGSVQLPGNLKWLLMEIPLLPSTAAGLSSVTVSLSAPLPNDQNVVCRLYEQDSAGNMYFIGHIVGTATAGSTEVALTGKVHHRYNPDRKLFLGLSAIMDAVSFTSTSDPTLMNQRYLLYIDWATGKEVLEPTSLPPFSVDIETFSSPLSSDFDRVNNVVGVIVPEPETGIWTFTVSGHNVPDGPQPYAVVVSGLSGEISGEVRPIASKPASVPDTTVQSQSRQSYGRSQLQSRYGIIDKESLADAFDATMTIAPGAGQSSLASFRYAVSALGGREVSTLNLLKLKDNGTSLEFVYSETGDFADGNWWLSDMAGIVLLPEDTVHDDVTYQVNIVVADNGPFDLDPAVNTVRDPSLLAGAPSGTMGGGCTVLPDTGGSWELPGLLGLVLGLAILRRVRRRVL